MCGHWLHTATTSPQESRTWSSRSSSKKSLPIRRGDAVVFDGEDDPLHAANRTDLYANAQSEENTSFDLIETCLIWNAGRRRAREGRRGAGNPRDLSTKRAWLPRGKRNQALRPRGCVGPRRNDLHRVSAVTRILKIPVSSPTRRDRYRVSPARNALSMMTPGAGATRAGRDYRKVEVSSAAPDTSGRRIY
jgi:hypothetical protein